MQLAVGQIVEGKITGITNFGVFVDLGDSVTGMVHISEVAHTYVGDIREFVKENDTVKMKVLSVREDGRVSLSIKKATPAPKPAARQHENSRKQDNSSFVWSAKKSEPASFEEMMNKFKATSEEKFSDLKRKNPEARRTKRGTGVK